MSFIPEHYHDREQTLVKHTILKSYLERFAHIIGWNWSSITYVDPFSGPWESRDTKYSDTSFGIAIEELRRARQHLRDQKGKVFVFDAFSLKKKQRLRLYLRISPRTFTMYKLRFAIACSRNVLMKSLTSSVKIKPHSRFSLSIPKDGLASTCGSLNLCFVSLEVKYL